MTTIMVHKCSDLLMDAKKDIIKCAWAFINDDDLVIRQTANLLAARFSQVFETTSKFLTRAWTGLLHPPQSECQILVLQALDIITTVLQQPNRTSPESGYPL